MKEEIYEIRERILALARLEEWSAIVELVESKNAELCNDGTILVCYADSNYELGNDVKAIEAYLKYLALFSDGKAKSFALFNLGLALSNLGMHEEALDYFRRTDEGHPSRDRTISETVDAVRKMRDVRIMLRDEA
jgi:tetratricopeptide (TPR) repeat protein